MPAPFHRLTPEEFAQLVARFPFTRRIDAVHMHHTWRPNRAMFTGVETIEGMWHYHTQVNHWRDIAQHVTIDPDGNVWTGRDWNSPPASSTGHNGTRYAGPFMFETIGDFDEGHDTLDGAQRRTVVDVIARVQRRHRLPPESLHFHRDMSPNTCPGTSVKYDEILAEVRRRHEELEREEAAAALAAASGGGSRGGARGVGRRGDAPSPDSDDDTLLERLLRDAHAAPAPSAGDGSDLETALAEPAEESAAPAEVLRALDAGRAPSMPGDGRARGGDGVSPDDLEALRPHVVNLSEGAFRQSGSYETTAADVDAIFDVHLPRWAEASASRSGPLRVLFWAHGGLVDERSGLDIARHHVDWWKANGVYPIYFVWETGFADALRSVLEAVQHRVPSRATRDLWDYTTDPVVEAGCRVLGGVQVWGAMKRSAELGVAQGTGGARYVAERLARYCAAVGRPIELFAAGHSAGSIFHSYFVPTAVEAGAPAFERLLLLAPAITVADFKTRLLPRLGAGKAVKRADVFTMHRSFEKADDCAGIYRKSLLYLIYNALESAPSTPVLGLEMSLVTDEALKRAFGLGGAPSPVGEVVWSVTSATSGPSASRARSHGDFDDDAPTMNAVACRVLGTQAPLAEYRAGARGARALGGASVWAENRSWLERFDLEATPIEEPAAAAPPRRPPPPVAPSPVEDRKMPEHGRGRRLALCVGIDRYPAPNALGGCVNDARTWAASLQRRGFTVSTLTDGAATYRGITGELARLVSGARAGDVVVFQYSGHGTQLPDSTGDETDHKDEALCPVDFDGGAFVVDDDMRAILARAAAGVNVTCFIDCCHSGTITRLLVGTPVSRDGALGEARARYIVATPEMIEAHLKFRADGDTAARALGAAAPLGAAAARGLDVMREVSFAACRANEVAYEHAGQGDFTRHATPLLDAADGALTHEAFERRVIRAFGARPAQHPRLDCAPPSRTRVLFAPLGAAIAAPTRGLGEAIAADGGGGGTPAPRDVMSIAAELRGVADELDRAR